MNSEQGDPPEVRELKAQKDEAILVLLAKLALVYWRPDFTPSQAKQLYAQYLDDLRDLPFSSVSQAIEAYRRDPENKFYPTPGQLRGLVTTPPSWWPSGRNSWAKEIRQDGQTELLRILDGDQKLLAAE